jgi:hypothetical protein
MADQDGHEDHRPGPVLEFVRMVYSAKGYQRNKIVPLPPEQAAEFIAEGIAEVPTIREVQTRV